MEQAELAAERLQKYPGIKTSEAQTKNSLIEPFLRCLGYDPSHPEQVTLEVSTELGGKIDYVLTGRAEVKVAVEAKKAGTHLSEKETNQLRSYFTFSDVVAGILTNGIEYWLFTDIDKTNVMDSEPYRKIDLLRLHTNDLQHLAALARGQIRQNDVHERAEGEQRRVLVNRVVTEELVSPSQEFLRLVGKKAGIKPLTKANLESLGPLVAEAVSRNLSAEAPPDPRPAPTSSAGSGGISKAGSELTPGKKAALTKSRFKGATLFGETLPDCENYTRMLISVVKELQTRHPKDFAARVSDSDIFKGRVWWYISNRLEDINPNPRHSKSKVGGYWLDTNLNAENKVKRARLFLSAFGHDPDELVVHTSDE